MVRWPASATPPADRARPGRSRRLSACDGQARVRQPDWQHEGPDGPVQQSRPPAAMAAFDPVTRRRIHRRHHRHPRLRWAAVRPLMAMTAVCRRAHTHDWTGTGRGGRSSADGQTRITSVRCRRSSASMSTLAGRHTWPSCLEATSTAVSEGWFLPRKPKSPSVRGAPAECEHRCQRATQPRTRHWTGPDAPRSASKPVQ